MHVTLPAWFNSLFGKDMVISPIFLQLFSSIDLRVLQTSEHHTKAVKISAPCLKAKLSQKLNLIMSQCMLQSRISLTLPRIALELNGIIVITKPPNLEKATI